MADKFAIVLDSAELDLVCTALELFKFRLSPKTEQVEDSGHWYAAKFTTRRIEALLVDLRSKEPIGDGASEAGSVA